MDMSIKPYVIGGYKEYKVERLDCLNEAFWIHSTPLNAPVGGHHYLLPEPAANIALSRRFDDHGSTFDEQILLCGPISRPCKFPLKPGHELIATRIKPEWIPSLFGIKAEDIKAWSVNGYFIGIYPVILKNATKIPCF